jgi:uncharacterized protein
VNKPLVVFDCVVLVQSLLKKAGPAVECVNRFRDGHLTLVISKETLAELRDVLSRSSLRDRYPLLTAERVEALISLLRWKGELIRHVPKRFVYPRDPNDEPYLNLAIEAQADYLVTRDNDLLELMKWDTEEGRVFQKQFRSLHIVDPVTFLNEIEQS